MDDTVVLSSTQIETSAPQILQNLMKDQNFTDVTLVTADNQQIIAHKAILSACSPFFQNLLITNPHPKLLLYLRGVQAQELRCLVEYMYLGEIQVLSHHLNTFLQVGEELGICGLRGNKEEKTNLDMIIKTGANNYHTSSICSELNLKYVTAKQETTDTNKDVGRSRKATQTLEQIEGRSASLASSELVSTPNKLACKRCYVQFSSLRTLTRHTCKHNSGKFECKICSAKFQIVNFLSMHMLEKHGIIEKVDDPTKRSLNE